MLSLKNSSLSIPIIQSGALAVETQAWLCVKYQSENVIITNSCYNRI